MMEISMKFPDSGTGSAVAPIDNITSAFPQSDCFKDLECLIGLKEIKRTLAEITAFSLVQSKRTALHLKACPNVLHMVFKGNPGTGKTTVARILGKMFAEIGVLSRGHLVEVERADLVGEYIGHTAQKTREVLKKAQGGILFIDEAYTLCQGGEKDFGREAIGTMVKMMEDERNNFVIILAGYSLEMGRFLQSNPGLRSRFPIHIDFPDYDADDLLQIALLMYQERDYELTNRARWKLKNYLNEFCRTRHPHSGNARYVRNLVEKSIRLQALRIVDRDNLRRKDLITIDENVLPLPEQMIR